MTSQRQAWKDLKPGRFIVIRISPVASVRFLGDARATKAAASLPSHSYVAYVNDAEQWTGKAPRYATISVLLVGAALPTYDPSHSSDPTKCIPIYPATINPLRRLPLRPTDSLPYPASYIHTAREGQIGVHSIDPRNQSLSFLFFEGEEQRKKWNDVLAEDRVRPSSISVFSTITSDISSPVSIPPSKSLHFNSTDPKYLPPVTSPASNVQRSQGLSQQRDQKVPEASEKFTRPDEIIYGENEVGGEDEEDESFGAHPLDDFEPPDRWKPLVDIAYDLSSVKELSDPINFSKEISAIQAIVTRAWERHSAFQALIEKPVVEQGPTDWYFQADHDVEQVPQELERPKSQAEPSAVAPVEEISPPHRCISPIPSEIHEGRTSRLSFLRVSLKRRPSTVSSTNSTPTSLASKPIQERGIGVKLRSALRKLLLPAT